MTTKTWLFLGLLLLSSSCASLLNDSTQTVHIFTNASTEIIHAGDTLCSNKRQTKIRVQRSAAPLQLTILSDSLSRPLTLAPKKSWAYWYNFITNAGVGVFVDRHSDKQFGYPRHIFVDVTKEEAAFSLYNTFDKRNNLFLHFSLPHLNHYHYHPPGESGPKNSIGFWGLQLGLDYYYHPNRYIQLTVATIADLFIPFPASINYEGEYESFGASFLNLSHHHQFGRFSIGYGLSYGRNRWARRYSKLSEEELAEPDYNPAERRYNTLGAVVPTYVQLGPKFHLGMVYRPTFWQFHSGTRQRYEHSISLDLAWKFQLTR